VIPKVPVIHAMQAISYHLINVFSVLSLVHHVTMEYVKAVLQATLYQAPSVSRVLLTV